MSNATYRKMTKVKVASSQAQTQTQAQAQPQVQSQPQPKALSAKAREIYDVEDYDDGYEGVEEQPAGLLSTPVRAMALGGAIVVLVIVMAAAVWLLSSDKSAIAGTTGAPAAEGITVGKIAKDFSLVNVRTNQTMKLSSLRGKPVWMNFWGTWCPPCRGEMPEMQKMFDKYHDQVEIIGVSMAPRDTPDLVKNFVDQANYKWDFIHDADTNVAIAYQVNSVPSSYFIDKTGVIRYVRIGAMDSTVMEDALKKIR